MRDVVYCRLFAAQVAALLGTGLTTVALALLAFELAGGDAGQVLGTALAIKMIAYVTLGPVAGAIAGQVSRRRLLIGLDLVRAGIVACLPFVTATWQIYVLIFLMQACAAFFTPTFQAAIPDVLEDEEDYTKALSLSRLAYDLESMASPLIAASLLVFMSFNVLFGLNAIAFFVSAALLLSIKLPLSNDERRDDEGILERFSFGIRAYLRTPRLRGLLALSMAVAAAGSMVIVNTVVYVQQFLKLDQSATALALAAFGFGSMCAAFGLPRVLTQLTDRTVMLGGGLVMALSLAIGTSMPEFAGLLMLWYLLGFGFAAVQTPAGRLLRASSGDGNRTAYFAAQFALSHACWLITYPLAGWLSSAYGLQVAFVVLFAITSLAIVAALAVWPQADPQVSTNQRTN